MQALVLGNESLLLFCFRISLILSSLDISNSVVWHSLAEGNSEPRMTPSQSLLFNYSGNLDNIKSFLSHPFVITDSLGWCPGSNFQWSWFMPRNCQGTKALQQNLLRMTKLETTSHTALSPCPDSWPQPCVYTAIPGNGMDDLFPLPSSVPLQDSKHECCWWCWHSNCLKRVWWILCFHHSLDVQSWGPTKFAVTPFVIATEAFSH